MPVDWRPPNFFTIILYRTLPPKGQGSDYLVYGNNDPTGLSYKPHPFLSIRALYPCVPLTEANCASFIFVHRCCHLRGTPRPPSHDKLTSTPKLPKSTHRPDTLVKTLVICHVVSH